MPVLLPVDSTNLRVLHTIAVSRRIHYPSDAFHAELSSYTAPIPLPSHQLTMHSPATTAATTPATTPLTTPASTPATSHHQLEHDDTPERLPTKPVCLPFVHDAPRLTRRAARVDQRFPPGHAIQSRVDVRATHLFVRQGWHRGSSREVLAGTLPRLS